MGHQAEPSQNRIQALTCLVLPDASGWQGEGSLSTPPMAWTQKLGRAELGHVGWFAVAKVEDSHQPSRAHDLPEECHEYRETGGQGTWPD